MIGKKWQVTNESETLKMSYFCCIALNEECEDFVGLQKEAVTTDRRQDKRHSHGLQWTVFGGAFCHHGVARP
jgi:hypothetical protein